MKNTLKLLIFLSLWHITPSFASASRIALVIGNSQYTQLKPLSNPKNDAKAIGKALRNVGFKLLDNKVLYNLNEMQFLSVIKRFARQAQGTEMALIYYAGHGVQIGSGSYLLPVDIPKHIELIERRGIALDTVLNKLKGKSALNIAIFDACREIPKLEDEANRAGFGSSVRAFGRSHALVGRSQIIAYSTATGEYAKDGSGRHSPYTQALLNQLNTSTLDVRDLFDQVAYDVSVKSGQIPDVVAKAVQPNTYYFRKPAIKPILVSKPQNAEISFWNSIANETNAAYFESYLQQYPRGVYIKLARLKSKQYGTPEVVLNSKIAFTVKTSPENAKVRILNIAPVYQAGILLKAGNYKIEVSAKGYQKQRSDFDLTADNAMYFVELKQKQAIATTKVQSPAQRKKNDTAVKANYVIQGNGTVIDTDSGLQWMRCSLGQTWQNNTCVGKSKEYKWQEALDVGNGYFYAGYSGWRVPTIHELNTLVYCSNGKSIQYEKNGNDIQSEGGSGCKSNSRGDYKRPTIHQGIFPNTVASVVWSSSPNAGSSVNAWFIYFDDGNTYSYNRYNFKHVRLVRSGQ